jgi:hypothetical protein
MRHWLLLALCLGCGTKANNKYCDTTCPNGMTCDQVAHVCVAGMPDMAVPDMAERDMTVPIDLNGIDLSNVDFTVVPACTMSSTCPDGLPVCDSNSQMCRACNAAADDSVCVARNAATPHCKLAGTNMGLCAACNVSGDCPSPAPFCNADGTCRKCAANSECASLICDTGSGQCASESDVVYVNYVNDPGQSTCSDTGKDGSKAHPYCQITTALTLVGISTRHFVHVEGSATNYDPFEIVSTNGSLTFIGPGKDAGTPATVKPAIAANYALLIDPTGAQTATVAIEGMTFVGNGGASVLYCNGNNTTDLTIIDSSFSSSTKGAVNLTNCTAKISESYLFNTTDGLLLGPGANYSVQNCFMYGNNTGVQFVNGSSGNFSFNSVGNNTGSQGVFCGNSVTAMISDSIVWGNKKNGGTQFNGTNCILNNVVTGTDNYSGLGSKIQLDVAFVGTSDLHLDTGAGLATNQACCIDKINGPSPSPSPLPTVDIDSNPRPKGLHWDIGADEAM